MAKDTLLVNVAGLLTGSERRLQAVHVDAPKAAFASLSPTARGVHISAIGIDAGNTAFARSKLSGEAAVTGENVTILRPGLVMADTSYGGTSLARALAVLPLVTPVIGDGTQVFNPIHATDLADIVAACLTQATPPGPHPIGGPEQISQAQMLTKLRTWMGLAPARILPLPFGLARVLGAIGDALRLGPISRTSVGQIQNSLLADGADFCVKLGLTPRPFSTFLNARPAGTQDLWQARLYFLNPLIRMTLALLWLVSGILGLTLPTATFLPLIDTALPDTALTVMARAGGLIDLAIAAALIRNWQPRATAALQALMVASYTLAFTVLAPALWLLPLGGLLKNLPILALIATAAILQEER